MARPDHHDSARAIGLRQLAESEADCASSQNHNRVRGVNGCPVQRVGSAGVAIEDGGGIVGHVVGQGIAVFGDADVVFRESVAGLPFPVPESSYRTDVVLTLFAEPSIAAPQKMLGLNSNKLSDREIGYTIIQGNDFARKLVASLVRFHQGGGPVRVQVATANSAGSPMKQNLPRPRFWRRNLLQPNVRAAVENRRLHIFPRYLKSENLIP